MSNNLSIKKEISKIDRDVERLEKINSDWMASHGEMNNGIYERIQKLMDRRDYLVELLRLEK